MCAESDQATKTRQKTERAAEARASFTACEVCFSEVLPQHIHKALIKKVKLLLGRAVFVVCGLHTHKRERAREGEPERRERAY